MLFHSQNNIEKKNRSDEFLSSSSLSSFVKHLMQHWNMVNSRCYWIALAIIRFWRTNIYIEIQYISWAQKKIIRGTSTKECKSQFSKIFNPITHLDQTMDQMKLDFFLMLFLSISAVNDRSCECVCYFLPALSKSCSYLEMGVYWNHLPVR